MRATPSSRRRPAVSRMVPGVQAPTRHPRREGLGTLRAGERLTVRFTGIDPDGSATVRIGPARLAVPLAVPGEEAVVEVTRGGRRAEGRLVALLRKSASIIPVRCHHFGRCGGCQWQHLSPDLQRRLTTRMVKDYLKEHADLRPELVADTVGGEAWAYRSTLRAVYAERGGEIVVGYHAGGSGGVLDIAQCPVQHPANEAMFRAARDAVGDLRRAVSDPASGTGGLRGIIGLASFATDQALLVISTAAPLRDPTAAVRAFIDRVPGLVGILSTVRPAPSPDLLGPRLRLLWGRAYLHEEIAGLRIRVRPTTEMPANPRAMGLLIDAVARAAEMGPRETALDMRVQTPLFTLALAGSCEGATGVVSGRQALDDAWEAARWNGVPTVLFTGHAPGEVLAALAARRRPDAVVITAAGQGVDAAVIEAVSRAGVPRVVYVARALTVCARDLTAWRRAGYGAVSVQPVELLPQTSRVHVVTALRRRV